MYYWPAIMQLVKLQLHNQNLSVELSTLECPKVSSPRRIREERESLHRMEIHYKHHYVTWTFLYMSSAVLHFEHSLHDVHVYSAFPFSCFSLLEMHPLARCRHTLSRRFNPSYAGVVLFILTTIPAFFDLPSSLHFYGRYSARDHFGQDCLSCPVGKPSVKVSNVGCSSVGASV